MDRIIDYILQTVGVDWDDVKQTPDTGRLDRSIPWQKALNDNHGALHNRLRADPDFKSEVRECALDSFEPTGHRYLDDTRKVVLLESFLCGNHVFRDVEGKSLPVRACEEQVKRFLQLIERYPDCPTMRFGKCVFDFWDGQYFKTGDCFQALYTDPDFYPTGFLWKSCGSVANVPDKVCGEETEGKFPQASPMKVEVGGGSMGPSVFIGCDGYYFEIFAKQFAEGMANAPFFKGLYIHVTNPAGLFKQTCDDLLALSKASHWKLTISTDNVDPSVEVAYYACQRYILFNTIQKQTGDDYFLLDIDFVFDIRTMNLTSATFPERQLRVRNGPMFIPGSRHYLPWMYCAGCIVWLPVSDMTTRFVEAVSHYINAGWRTGAPNWFIDQVAAFYAHQRLCAVDEISDIYHLRPLLGNEDSIKNLDKNTAGMQHPVISRLMSEEKMPFRRAVEWAQNNQ